MTITRTNNIGFLRLLLATLVIVSHAPLIISGRDTLDPLQTIVGTRSLGELAVDAFFLLSGYLIVQSYSRSRSKVGFLSKRVRRIYPGYLVAFSVCMFIVAPLTGTALSSLDTRDWIHSLMNALGLQGLWIVGFIGLPFESLNGAVWTISYEFRCYLLVLLFGALGFYRKPQRLLLLTSILLLLSSKLWPFQLPGAVAFFTGKLNESIRLLSAFCVGSLFYCFKDAIQLKGQLALACALAMLLLAARATLEVPAFAVLGGYILFWSSFAAKSKLLESINADDDVSYGVYLYGWPISSLLVYFFHVKSAIGLVVLTLPLAFAAGFASWHLVERGFVRSRSLQPVSLHSAAP